VFRAWKACSEICKIYIKYSYYNRFPLRACVSFSCQYEFFSCGSNEHAQSNTQLHIESLTFLFDMLQGVCMRFLYVSIKNKISSDYCIPSAYFSKILFLRGLKCFTKHVNLHSGSLNKMKSPSCFTFEKVVYTVAKRERFPCDPYYCWMLPSSGIQHPVPPV
jgi:hypothetical protein